MRPIETRKGVSKIYLTRLSVPTHLRTCDRLKAPKFLAKIWQPDCVMEDPIRAIVIGIRPTNYANHRQVLTVSSGDGVEDAEPTDGEGDHTRANSLGTRVAVCCVAGVELIAAADQVELWLGDQMV